MISAFTLVKVNPEKNIHVYEEIKKFPIVDEAILVYGEYDIILKTHTKSMGELNAFIYETLRKIPNISMTTTMIVATIPSKK